jgi:hypothetical protein
VGKDDWAIVVGIKNYFDPNLRGLEGPETDAAEFHRWVVADEGGGVPPGQATLIRSSDYGPPFLAPEKAMPTAEIIKAACDHLLAVASENESKGLGRVVGHRLYLFFAGHGFAPTHRDDLTALLTAEASVADAHLSHVLGPYMADFFWRGKFFEEILLFMDCCRELMDCAQLYMPYAGQEERASDFWKVRRFYAYGARVAKESREWKMADNQYHGVFTKTLLDALGSTGYDPADPSRITADSLSDQLYNGFKGFMSEPDRKRPDVPHEPEIVYERRPGANFTIVTRVGRVRRVLAPVSAMLGFTQVPKFSVTILVSKPGLVGQRATISNKDLRTVAEQALSAKTVVALERGFYALEVAGVDPLPFEVTGENVEVHV